MDNKEKKTKGLVGILLLVTESQTKCLIEMESFQSLTASEKNEIALEFLFFNIHQFIRTLLVWIGAEEMNELMTSVVFEIREFLVKKSKNEMEKQYADLSVDNFEECLDVVFLDETLSDFVSLHVEREKEYSGYLDRPRKGEGYAGTLLWEFANKIANMMHREKDVFLIMKIQQLGIGFTYFADAIKRVVVEKGKDN